MDKTSSTGGCIVTSSPTRKARGRFSRSCEMDGLSRFFTVFPSIAGGILNRHTANAVFSAIVLAAIMLPCIWMFFYQLAEYGVM